MNSFPKTEYQRPLVPNSESVYKITNPSLNNICSPYVAENKAEFVSVKRKIYISVSLC